MDLDAYFAENPMGGSFPTNPDFKSGFVTLVGRPNAGKSTLLNHLTSAEIHANNRLFDTLDTTTRTLEISDTCTVLLSDTVGFIRKLPHHLIEAFRSTMEEAKYADIIIHVVDSSKPQREKQMYIVYETLRNLGVSGKKTITLFNKQDKLVENEILKDAYADKTLKISARTGEGMPQLLEALEEFLREDKQLLEGIFPYGKGSQVSQIRKYGELLEEDYRENGIYVKAFVPTELYHNLGKGMCSSGS